MSSSVRAAEASFYAIVRPAPRQGIQVIITSLNADIEGEDENTARVYAFENGTPRGFGLAFSKGLDRHRIPYRLHYEHIGAQGVGDGERHLPHLYVREIGAGNAESAIRLLEKIGGGPRYVMWELLPAERAA